MTEDTAGPLSCDGKTATLSELELAQLWHQSGRKIAIATVVQTWGSSPRPVGSQMIVDENGGMQGSVSGGCVEGAVVHEALRTIANGLPQTLNFSITDDTAWAVGLACGGRIQVYVEPLV